MKITEKQLAASSVVSIVGLLFIWVIPNTIALRHAFLVISFLSAIGLIRYHWGEFKAAGFKLIPLLCLCSLFVWVIIHYYFFSLNPELELLEIKGIWMRSLLGAVAAIGLGIAIYRYPSLRIYFYIALFSTPLINVVSYCWASYLNHGLVKPNDFVRFLFTKIETAFFGGIAAAVATGNLMYLLVRKLDKSTAIQILLWLMGLVLVLLSAFISNTKNGIAISLGLCALLAMVMIVNFFLHRAKSRVLPMIIVLIIVLLSLGVWEGHKSSANRGWETVFEDAVLGLDIEGNKQWQKIEGTVPLPLNSLGIPAASNTYTRFAYAAAGIQLITDFPLGYGSINRSFTGLLKYAQIPHEHESQAHSGWIDFGLAFGIPGLLLILVTMLSVIYFGLQSKSSSALPWVIFCLSFIPFGLIAEIVWKQYFEATIFFLSVGSTVVIFDKRQS